MEEEAFAEDAQQLDWPRVAGQVRSSCASPPAAKPVAPANFAKVGARCWAEVHGEAGTTDLPPALSESTPLLPGGGGKPRRKYRYSRLRGGSSGEGAMVLCLTCVCLGLCLLIPMGIIAWVGSSRGYGCDPEKIGTLVAPYGGQLMPASVTLKEQQSFFQFGKQVHVFPVGNETEAARIGTFYDMNFFFFMHFGYQDAQENTWFEANVRAFA